MYVEQLTQALGFATPVHPQLINNATLNSGGVDMSVFHRALFVLDVGAITSSGSITATLQESSDGSTNWTNLSGSNVSQSAITTASKLYTFEARADQMSKRYLRLSVQETVGQNVYVCVVAFGAEASHKPGNAQNATVVSTQNVVA
jgi:hypothetical protein